MKTRILSIAVLVLSGALLYAQTTTPQTPPAGAQGQTGAGSAKSTQSAPAHRGMGMPGMEGMHAQHMQQMQSDLAKMKGLLTDMRTSVSSMDPKDQPAMMANIQLWQMMIDHLEQMMTHMQSMGGMEGMHQGGMQHEHGAMKKGATPGGKQKTTPPSTTPPQ